MSSFTPENSRDENIAAYPRVIVVDGWRYVEVVVGQSVAWMREDVYRRTHGITI